jgi:hypothetical protein
MARSLMLALLFVSTPARAQHGDVSLERFELIEGRIDEAQVRRALASQRFRIGGCHSGTQPIEGLEVLLSIANDGVAQAQPYDDATLACLVSRLIILVRFPVSSAGSTVRLVFTLWPSRAPTDAEIAALRERTMSRSQEARCVLRAARRLERLLDLFERSRATRREYLARRIGAVHEEVEACDAPLDALSTLTNLVADPSLRDP